MTLFPLPTDPIQRLETLDRRRQVASMRFTGPVEKPGWHKRLRTAWRRWQNSRVSRREQFDMIQMKIDTALAATSCAMVELHKEHLRTAAEFRKKIVELEKRLRESGNG